MKVLSPSELKAAAGKILDAAKRNPQYVMRDGVLLVIHRTESASDSIEQTDIIADTWSQLGPAPTINYDKI